MENYEEENPPDLTIEEVKEKLLKYDSNIDKSEIKFLYHGSYNVYLIQNDLILKIPDKNLLIIIGGNQIEKEVNILDELKNKLKIFIPEPIYVSNEPDNKFYIYKKIPGISLSRVFSTLTNSTKLSIAKDLGKIISELHSLQASFPELTKSLSLNKTSNQYYESILSLYRNIEKKIYPILTQKQKSWVNLLFETFFNSQKTPIRLTTTHNDLDTSNILVDQKNNYEISGLIDFEEFGLGDPAVDFLFQDEGKQFHESVINHYTTQKDSNFNLRMNFHKNKTCLFYILTGIENKLPEMIAYGLKKLDFFMKNSLDSLV